jgi:hypothetical protein
MGKVKQALDEVRIEIEDILSGELITKETIDVEDVKIILKNKYFFNTNNNSYYIDERVIEDLYVDIRKKNEEY